LALFGDALAGEGIAAQPALAAILESATAHLEYRLDRYAAATAAASRALAAVRATRDTGTRLLCHKVLGGCALRLGRLDDARRHYQHALELAPPDVDPHQAAALLDNLALVEKAQGRYDEALRLSLASLAQHRRLGDAAGVALCLNNLAALHVDRHDHAAAAMYLREALAIAERHGLVTTVAFAHANLAEIALKEGDDAAAEEHARRAQESATAVGNRGLAALLGPVFTRLALRRGDHAGARAELASASSIAMDIDRPQAKLACVIAFADLIEALGEAVAARRVLAWIAAHPKTHPLERDEALARLARGTAESGEPPPPAIDLDEFVQRIAIEAPLMHAPLIALLRASANDR
jgi:tetratricopeptide (TPR) repeat protein